MTGDTIDDTIIDTEALRALAAQKPTPLRLQDMYNYAKDDGNSNSSDKTNNRRLRNARFLHRELPIRVAQRAVDLLTLPHGLHETAPIRRVAFLYLKYLHGMETTPEPTTPEEEAAFTETLARFVQDRTSIPMDIARGIRVWEEEHCYHRKEDLDLSRLRNMEDALYRFFTARVGLRFLTEHHILSSPACQIKHNGGGDGSSSNDCDGDDGNHAGIDDTNPSLSSEQLRRDHHSLLSPNDTDNSFLGCIQTECDPVQEVTKVVKEVRRQTKEKYGGVCPPIEIVDCSSNSSSGGDGGTSNTTTTTKFTYVPHHLQYMVAELLKNSCRATVRRYLANNNNNNNNNSKDGMHPIRVVVVRGAEDVSIKIADRGGGVSRSTMKQIWRFAHSTADDDFVDANNNNDNDDNNDDLITGAGHIRGFGLPLARIYARYFGGELTLKSMEGFGCDAYLYLPRLGDSCENLPLSVTASPGERDSLPAGTAKYRALTGSSSRRNYGTMAKAALAAVVQVVRPVTLLTREEIQEKKVFRVMNVLNSRAL